MQRLSYRHGEFRRDEQGVRDPVRRAISSPHHRSRRRPSTRRTSRDRARRSTQTLILFRPFLPGTPMHIRRIASLSVIAALVIGAATAGAQRILADFSGTWNVTIEGPQGPMNSQLSLKQTADTISGEFSSEIGK